MDSDKPLFATEAGDKERDGVVKQEFKLFIKASQIDKETRGSCPVCQQWFMVAYLIAQKQEGVNFSVYTVQESAPPKEFDGWSKKFPVVLPVSCVDKKGQPIGEELFDTYEELEKFFEAINRDCPELKRHNIENSEAVLRIDNLYTVFKHVLAGQPKEKMLKALRALDQELDNELSFFIDDQLCFVDCILLPRLQHIKVTAKRFLDFEIPLDCKAIWRYLKNAYTQPAFLQTMPSDQDIGYHYAKGPRHSAQTKTLTREPFSYSTDVPEEILNESNGDQQKNGLEQVTQEQEEVQEQLQEQDNGMECQSTE